MTYSNIIESAQSGYIEISVPLVSGGTTNVKGLLQDDVSIKLGNNWQPFKEFDKAIDGLRDIQNIFSTSDMLQWTEASAQTWRGNKPIDITTNFYVINYNSNSNAASQVKSLANLAAASIDSSQTLSATPHGGYKYEYSDDNSTLSNKVLNGSRPSGTVTITLNKKTVINGLLLKDIAIKPSTVAVYNKQPLYYDINAMFMLYRSPIESDLKTMFGG